MSMEQQGWIKLYRKLLNSPIFSSEKGLKVWVWCLLKATHGGYEQYVGRSLVKLKPGEFVFGRKVAAGELRMKQSTIWGWISQLKSDSYVNINTNNKYSVISIINWKYYQGLNSKTNNRVTTNRQQMDTNKKDKKVKNENIYSSRECLTDELCREIANEYSVDFKPVCNIRDDLKGYYEKEYKNYKATLQNWTRKAIRERKIFKKVVQQAPQEYPELSEEERIRNRATLNQMRQNLNKTLGVGGRV